MKTEMEVGGISAVFATPRPSDGTDGLARGNDISRPHFPIIPEVAVKRTQPVTAWQPVFHDDQVPPGWVGSIRRNDAAEPDQTVCNRENCLSGPVVQGWRRAPISPGWRSFWGPVPAAVVTHVDLAREIPGLPGNPFSEGFPGFEKAPDRGSEGAHGRICLREKGFQEPRIPSGCPSPLLPMYSQVSGHHHKKKENDCGNRPALFPASWFRPGSVRKRPFGPLSLSLSEGWGDVIFIPGFGITSPEYRCRPSSGHASSLPRSPTAIKRYRVVGRDIHLSAGVTTIQFTGPGP